MKDEADFASILDQVERNELVETLSAALRGEASNDDERRVVLEYLHRKRFINLELSRPMSASKGIPVIEIVGATLTASGGQLLDWLDESERAAAGQNTDSPTAAAE